MGICMYRCINTAFLVWLGCLCVYDFKADCFILNKQLGGSFNTNSPSFSTHQRPLVFCTGCAFVRVSLFCIHIFMAIAIVCILVMQPFIDRFS